MRTSTTVLGIVGTLATLALPLSVQALTFTWDVARGQEATPPQWEVFMTKAVSGDVSQVTEKLTPLDDASCKAIYDQAGEPAYNADTSWCATITCPGAGAYTALLHKEGDTPTVQNSSSFGLDAQCKMVPYEEALMAALPSEDATKATGDGTTPASQRGPQVADGTKPPAATGDTDAETDDETSSKAKDTPATTGTGTTTPSGGTAGKPGTTTGTPTAGGTTGTHVTALPAPRVLDVAPSTSPSTGTGGQTASGSTGQPSTGNTPGTETSGPPSSTGSPGTTTAEGTPSTGTPPTGGTTPPGTGSPTPTSTPAGPFGDLAKQFDTLKATYTKKLAEIDTWYKAEIQKILSAAKKDGNKQLQKLYQDAQNKQFSAFVDAGSQWDDLYAKAVAQQQAPPTGTAQTPAGSGTPGTGTTAGGTDGGTAGGTSTASTASMPQVRGAGNHVTIQAAPPATSTQAALGVKDETATKAPK